MIELKLFNVIIPEDDDDFDSMLLEFKEDYTWTNARGKEWTFKKGWRTDGMTKGPLRHFGQCFWASAAHDLDCENAKTYKERVAGDAEFRANMKDLGASKFFYATHYLGVSLKAQWMRIKGDFR